MIGCFNTIVNAYTSLIPQICSDGFLSKNVAWMLSDTEMVYRPAVRCCASLMVSSEPSIIDQAFMEGIVEAFFKNLFRN